VLSTERTAIVLLGKSVETSLDAADTSPAPVLWPD
jgi:hypothetical protein